MHVKKEVLCCKFLIFNNSNFVLFRVFLLYTSIESTRVSKRSMQIPIKIPTGSIQDIVYFTFSYIHGSWLFILWFHCWLCNKKLTFRVITGFVKKEVLCCKFLIFNNSNFVLFRVFLLYTSIESTRVSIFFLKIRVKSSFSPSSF
jgi:hypothetical protein